MSQNSSYTSWKIICDSPEEADSLQSWLSSRIDPDRVITDSVRTFPGGAEQARTVSHRLGDYFASIRMLPDASPNQNSFQLVFHKSKDAKRYWKDLMVNILQQVEASMARPVIELESKRNGA